MKFQLPRADAMVIALAIGGFVVAQTAGWATGATDAKHPILVIDKHAIMSGSKLGQNIRQQIMDYENKVQTDLGPQANALQSEVQALQQQPQSAGRDKKLQAAQAKEAAFRQSIQERQSLIQGGEMVASKRFFAELAAAVESIMQERGADAVVEKSSIVASVGGLDITQAVTDRLDHKMTSFKVPLVKAPPQNMLPVQQ